MTETKTLLQAWVDKLRSGEIPQGRGQLRKDDGSMCCLGVLAELHPDATYLPDVTNYTNGDEYRWDVVDDDGQHYISSTEIPWQVLEHVLNLRRDDGWRVGKRLIAINDDEETGTFTEIASLIEQVGANGPRCLMEVTI